jgi:superfamily II DNA or RNA helicase
LVEVSERFAALRPGVTLRPHQRDALDGVAKVLADGGRRVWVVLPPGAGKTLVGLEAARRLGQPIVAFAPNTAIQGQWLAEWGRFAPDPPAGSTDRGLDAALTALTYQSLATFDPEAEVDPDGNDRSVHIRRLRPEGRELVTALGRRPVTLVLDECHHLLDVWGELLAEVLEHLPEAAVVGLTATPPTALTSDERVLVDRLFGQLVTGPSIPAMVREGNLVPYAELAWLTTPTDREQAWLGAQAERFAELTTDLIDPNFAGVGFLPWLDRYAVRREHHAGDGPAIPWHRFARDRPEEADAVLRFHHAGLLALPEGARLHEQHRHAPDGDDWMRLLHPYAHRFLARSDDPRDAHAHQAIREALPGLGYRLTRSGILSGRSPVDRVIARSAAKVEAARDILTAEHDGLGERLRAVVVCDHEQARATLPSGLIGVLDSDAGSARLALHRLADLAWLRPMLVTGRTVAANAEVARSFLEYAARAAPDLRLALLSPDSPGIVHITGAWTPRRWVPLVTGFFVSGGSSVLIGTRALLGEGWDCAAVNTLVDLTEATTGTSVVQLRGRALRLDRKRPEKVAHTWSVVCVADNHPKGAADFERFVRKHDGYFGITEHGNVMAGVTHVDPGLSAFAPPAVAEFAEFNRRMLRRCGSRERTRDLWRVGEPYADRPAHVLRLVSPARIRERRPKPPAVRPGRYGLAGDTRSMRWLIEAVPAAATAGYVVAAGVDVIAILLLFGTLLALGTHARDAHARGRQLHEVAAATPDVPAIAFATAEAMHEAGLIDRGADAVTMTPEESGAWQFHLTGADPATSERYAAALDEVLSAPADPRYLIGRYIVPDPGPGSWARLRAGWRRPARWSSANAVAYHAVPTVLADHRRHADAFARAWRRWVSDWPQPIYTRSPEGALLLAAQRGLSPLDACTALRLTWE